MTKIVINKCYGGFGLSTQGMAHYLTLKGIPYETQASRFSFCKDDQDFYHAGYVGDDDHYICDRDIPRDDPALIQTVEELDGLADSAFSNLVVVEIPDGVEWQVEEYDGKEWIAEKHRTWG